MKSLHRDNDGVLVYWTGEVPEFVDLVPMYLKSGLFSEAGEAPITLQANGSVTVSGYVVQSVNYDALTVLPERYQQM